MYCEEEGEMFQTKWTLGLKLIDFLQKSNLLKDLLLFPNGVAVIQSGGLLRLFQSDKTEL